VAWWPPRLAQATTDVARTKRLLIRTFRNDDLPAVHAIYSESKVWRYLGTGPTISMQESRERLERMLGYQRDNGFTFWAVTNIDTGELLGD